MTCDAIETGKPKREKAVETLILNVMDPKGIDHVEYIDQHTIVRWADGTTAVLQGLVPNPVPRGTMARIVWQDGTARIEAAGTAPLKVKAEAEK